jgi:two-component system cell cycle response regulator
VGLLVLATDAADAFSDEETALLESLAARAGGAIERARRFRQSEEMAHTDPLTSLVNRRRFDERLSDAFSRAAASPGPFSLVVADLDHFKRINDGYGHPAGDAVLVELARRLAARRRAEDTVARLGGEEFGLILVRADRAGALAMAERLRQDVRATPFLLEGGERLDLTVSLGVATYPEDGADAATLLASADEALYRAKRGGRDRVASSQGAAIVDVPAPSRRGDRLEGASCPPLAPPALKSR